MSQDPQHSSQSIGKAKPMFPFSTQKVSTMPPIKRSLFLSLDEMQSVSQVLSSPSWLKTTLSNRKQRETNTSLEKDVISQALHAFPTPKIKCLKIASCLIEDDSSNHLFLGIAHLNAQNNPIQATPRYFNITHIDMGFPSLEVHLHNWKVPAKRVRDRIEKTKIDKDNLKYMVEILSETFRTILNTFVGSDS